MHYQLHLTDDRKVYFLSDFADNNSSINFKQARRKSVEWTPERERIARRGKNGRFGGLGNAIAKGTKTTATVALGSAAAIGSSPLWVKGLVAGAAATGLSVRQYTKSVQSYRNNIPGRLDEIRKTASSLNINIPPGKKNVSFVIGGFNGGAENASDLMKSSLSKTLGDSHHIISVDTSAFNTNNPLRKPQNKLLLKAEQARWGATQALQIPSLMVSKVLKDKKNVIAMDVSSQILAIKNKDPDINFSIIGHSGGGIAGNEIMENMKLMGIEARHVALGSPYFGLTEPSKDTLTLDSRSDFFSKYPKVNRKWVNSVKSHAIRDYLNNSEIQQNIKDWLKR